LAKIFELTAYKRLKGWNNQSASRAKKIRVGQATGQGKIQREADLDNAWLSNFEVISTTEMTWS
jgi:hypothetical protein